MLRTAVNETTPFVASTMEPTGIVVWASSGAAAPPGFFTVTVPVATSTTTDLPSRGVGVAGVSCEESLPELPESPDDEVPFDDPLFDVGLFGVVAVATGTVGTGTVGTGSVEISVVGTVVVSVVVSCVSEMRLNLPTELVTEPAPVTSTAR